MTNNNILTTQKSFFKSFLSVFSKENILSYSFLTLFLFLVVSVLITIREVFFSNDPVDSFKTFVFAHHHLLANKDLYAKYPLEYHTLYNYSPFFALLMGFFAYFPIWLGAILWNLLHTFNFWYAIQQLNYNVFQKVNTKYQQENNENLYSENITQHSKTQHSKQNFILWFCFVELTTALMNVQTNPTIVAILIWTFICFEKNNIFWASFWVIFGFYFKIYGVIGGALFMFYPNKLKFIGFCIFWAIIFAFLPLLFISFEQLIFQYKSWIVQLQDHSQRDSMTVMGVLDIWVGRYFSHKILILSGILLTIGLYFKIIFNKILTENSKFRLQFLASLLIFVVIFNPGSESPTYIIAVAGVAIWYALQNENIYHTKFLTFHWQKVVLILVTLFTCLAPTDIYPPFLRKFFEQNVIKAMPCILVWVIIMFELYFKTPKGGTNTKEN